jgi:hypothetical protein
MNAKKNKVEPKYPDDIFRVSHREMDLCHQISDESETNSSCEDHMGGNEKAEWDKEKLVIPNNKIYRIRF